MTKEEAIHFATCLKNNWTINFADMEDFCDMAIEALQSLSKPNNGLQGSDLIRRQDAIDAVIAEGRSVDSRYLEAERIVHESDAVEALSMLPSADRPTKHTLPDGTEIRIDEESYEIGYTEGQMADRPTGEWVLKEHLWECDKCGCRINRAKPLKGNIWNYNYCPNCGARMVREDGGEE